MFRPSWGLIRYLMIGDNPPFPNSVQDDFEELPYEGLTMGTLIIGRPGTGKTTMLARLLVEYFMSFDSRPIFILDWSGSITDSILSIILSQPKHIRERLVRRIVYDPLGSKEWIVPLPELSLDYGFDYEDQVQRVSVNLTKLQPELVSKAPIVAGLFIRDGVPHTLRLLTAIDNEQGHCWQITEAKGLLNDPRLLKQALKKYGYKVPESKWWLENIYYQWSRNEKDLRSYAFISLIGSIEPKEARARIGYPKPGWTPKEAIQKGLMVLIDGSRLINQKYLQHYLFTQAYSLIMAEINKRKPGNPLDEPVVLVLDEVYSILSIPAIAEDVGMLAPLYRSRKLELYVVLQALSQLADNLRRQIWTIGNIVCFGVSNFDEAYDIAQQLFPYDSRQIKLPARSNLSNPIIESDRGQYLEHANKIQRFLHRECIIRRYERESVQDQHIRYIPQTRELPSLPMVGEVENLKRQLLLNRGIRVEDALKVINNRNIASSKPPQI